MNKLAVYIVMVLAVLGVGFAISPKSANAISDCEVGYPPQNGETSSGGVLVYKYQICPTVGTLVLTFTEWVGSGSPISRNATVEESTTYDEYLSSIDNDTSQRRLNDDVETGKKWVGILREWEVQELDFYADWDSLSVGVKDSIAKESLRRNALIKGGLADLLVTLNKGR